MVSYLQCIVSLLLANCFMTSSTNAPGRFIYKESCGKFGHSRDVLGIQPLKWRRLKITSPNVAAPVHLLSNSGKNCTLKPNFHVQAILIGEDVDIKQLSHVCHFDKTHKHLQAPPGTVTLVSCNQDKIAAMDELNGTPKASPEYTILPVRSREGKDINVATVSTVPKDTTQENKMSVSTKTTTAKTPKTTTTITPATVVATKTSIGTPAAAKEEVSTGSHLVSSNIIKSTDASLATEIPAIVSPASSPNISTTLSPHSSTMEDDITTDSFPIEAERTDLTVPSSVEEERSNLTVASSVGEESSNLTVAPSVVTITMVTVTIDPFFTSTTVFSAGVPDIIVYSSILIGALLLILVIICSGCLIHRYRTHVNKTEINQKLVHKRENVINFRNAEEAVVYVNQAEVKYLTLGNSRQMGTVHLGINTGRKKTDRNSTIISEVPKCLK